MQEFKSSNLYINVFDNITEVKKYVTQRERKKGRDNDSEGTGNISFYGTRNFEDAIDKLTHGDEKLYERINKERKKINIDKIIGANNQRLKYKNRLYGSIPNVPAYLRNNPINMINAEKSQPSNKILNIFLNIRVNGGVDGDDIMEIGCKYLSIIDILEKCGYRCNLYSGCANGNSSTYEKSFMLVRIKTDKEPLNLKKICFTIANPGMQRRIKFKWMEVNDSETDFTREGYGNPVENDESRKILSEKLKDNIIVWNYESNNCSKTIEQLLEDLKKEYGIRIGED